MKRKSQTMYKQCYTIGGRPAVIEHPSPKKWVGHFCHSSINQIGDSKISVLQQLMQCH